VKFAVQRFFCDVQFHREPTHQALQLSDPLLLSTALLVLLEDEWCAFEKFGLPPGQHLRGELMLPTQFGGAMRSTHQVKDHLRFKFGCKGSSLYHRVPLSWF